jgi:hypothetical protein
MGSRLPFDWRHRQDVAEALILGVHLLVFPDGATALRFPTAHTVQ